MDYTSPHKMKQHPGRGGAGLQGYSMGVQGSGVQGPKLHADTSHYPSAHQQQVNLGDLSAGVTLEDLVPRVTALGFPASCRFVLGLLERYFISQLDAAKETSSTPPQLARENIVGLVKEFILSPSPPAAGGTGDKKEDKKASDGRGRSLSGRGKALSGRGTSLSPVEEMQLLLTIHSKIEEQENMKLRYCMFNALFGEAATEESKASSDILGKLVSLSVTLESRSVLACAAMWMEAHPVGGLSLARSIYYEFCALLPSAIGPMLGLAGHSPHFTRQMVTAFATLHPFHVVGTLLPMLDTSQLHPPIRILQLVLYWVELNSELFCCTLHPDLMLTRLPLLHPPPPTPPDLQSPVTGVIQWCVLAPMVNHAGLYSTMSKTTTKTNTGSKFTTKPELGTNLAANSKTSSDSAAADSVLAEGDSQFLLGRLHAEVLSLLLSPSQAPSSATRSSSALPPLSSDDVAVIVAALIAFSQKPSGGGGGRELEVKAEPRETDSGSGKMGASVERFAQFLQISLSTKTLQLKPEDLDSIASALPRNRLLDLVISHTKII